MAGGTPAGMTDDIVLLYYGDEEAAHGRVDKEFGRIVAIELLRCFAQGNVVEDDPVLLPSRGVAHVDMSKHWPVADLHGELLARPELDQQGYLVPGIGLTGGNIHLALPQCPDESAPPKITLEPPPP